MINILPKFSDLNLRMRMNQIELGKELTIVFPQNIRSSNPAPAPKSSEVNPSELENRAQAASIILRDLMVDKIKTWLNEDPLLWCQYGARIRLDKVAHMFVLTLRPVQGG
jgi:hypothetical protein